MGSLISKPKAPLAPKPIIITSPAIEPASAASSSETTAADIDSASGTEDDSATEAQDSEAHSANLLRRNRGRSGTILTSFRGVLNNQRQNSPRKTLLGE